jgi:hypothetical protein
MHSLERPKPFSEPKFERLDVGLNSTPSGQIELWFAQLLLGYINPLTASFERIDRWPNFGKNNFKSAA